MRGSLGMRLHVSGALVVEDGCGVGWMSGGGRVDGCRGGGEGWVAVVEGG